jgi:hypothetical protein
MRRSKNCFLTSSSVLQNVQFRLPETFCFEVGIVVQLSLKLLRHKGYYKYNLYISYDSHI